jgi:peptidoglycan/LPS O-acetylase OafA/YrhL
MNSPETGVTPSPRLSAARPEAADASRHVPSLDGVRGLAIVLVLAFHAWPSQWTAFGWMGVDLFFVLSGFLITGILFDGRETARRARTFYIRRILRIMPLYYAVLILMFVVLPLIHRPHDLVYEQLAGDQAWYWTYTSNWLLGLQIPPHFNYMNHFWSLAVEEQFYLVWPLVVWHTSRKTALRIAACAIAGALVCRIALAGAGVWWLATYFLTPCRLDALGVGSVIALALRAPGDPAVTARRVGDRMLRGAMAVTALVVVALMIGDRGFAATVRLPVSVNLTAIAWIFGWLVTIAATRQPRWLQWKPLRAAGQYSYGLYVIHPFVFAYLAARWPGGGLFAHGVAVVMVSASLAWLSYHGFEKRFLRLKPRLAPTMPLIALTPPHDELTYDRGIRVPVVK